MVKAILTKPLDGFPEGAERDFDQADFHALVRFGAVRPVAVTIEPAPDPDPTPAPPPATPAPLATPQAVPAPAAATDPAPAPSRRRKAH